MASNTKDEPSKKHNMVQSAQPPTLAPFANPHGFATDKTPPGFPMAIALTARLEQPRCWQELQIMVCIGVIRDTPFWYRYFWTAEPSAKKKNLEDEKDSVEATVEQETSKTTMAQRWKEEAARRILEMGTPMKEEDHQVNSSNNHTRRTASLELRLQRLQFEAIWDYAWQECQYHATKYLEEMTPDETYGMSSHRQLEQPRYHPRLTQHLYQSAVESVFQKDYIQPTENQHNLGQDHDGDHDHDHDEKSMLWLCDRINLQIKQLRQRKARRQQTLDLHPGANDHIIDWCHPSLYAYQHLRDCEPIGRESLYFFTEAPVVGRDKNANSEQQEQKSKNQDYYQITRAPQWDNFLGKEETERNKNMPNGMLQPVSQSGLQWLPSEFFVEQHELNGCLRRRCRIQSYISGLHPIENQNLYQSLEHLFANAALPVLELALAQTWCGPECDRRAIRERTQRIHIPEYYGNIAHEQQKKRQEQEEMGGDLFGNMGQEEDDDSEDPLSIVSHPFQTPPSYTAEYHPVSLCNRPLQVAIKLATLELKPGEEYGGGHWHVEGLLDERIVATACCYLEQENVQGGDLEFRTSINDPPNAVQDLPRAYYGGPLELEGFESDDDEDETSVIEDEEHWRERYFGVTDTLVQPRGKCSTVLPLTISGGGRGCRVLAWPNILQHRVGPVKLIDPSKPGRRTFCCFFLVDPSLRVKSTATVPPQPLEWLSDMLHDILFECGVKEGAVRDKIVGLVHALPRSEKDSKIQTRSSHWLSYEQACERRGVLLQERSMVQNGKHLSGGMGFFGASLVEDQFIYSD